MKKINYLWYEQYKNYGFSLIELVCVIGVLSVLLTFVVPGALDIIRNQRLNSATKDLASHLEYARSFAISDSSVVVCAYNKDDCDNNADDWSNGISIVKAKLQVVTPLKEPVKPQEPLLPPPYCSS